MSYNDFARSLKATGDWLEPDFEILESGFAPAPPFPLALMGRLADWIGGFAQSVSAPIDYAAAAVLALASACIGATRKVSPWAGWSEYPTLWVLMVGNPSASKSPVFAPLSAMLKAIEREEGSGHDAERRDYETRKQAAIEARESWESDVKRAVKNAAPPPLKPEGADEPQEPKPPRLVVADATIESLAPLFKANRRGLLLARDELAAWIGAFGKYGGDGDAAFFLERFNGLPVTVDRAKAGHTSAPCGLLAVYGGIQPERLHDLLLKRPDDGFVSRFLLTFPEAAPRLRPARVVDLDLLSNIFRRLRGLTFDCTADGEPTPRTISLSREATAAFEQWWKENGEAGEAASGFQAGSLGKGPGLVLRVALNLELLEWAAGPPAPEPSNVSEAATLAACALFDDYFAPMAARVFGGGTRGAGEIACERLLRHIRQVGEPVVNARMLQRAKLAGLRSAAQVSDALDALADAGWVRFSGGRDGGEPGRQRSDWEVNPALWEAR